MRYATAMMEQADRQEVFRIYVTEHLRGMSFESSYYELVHGSKQEDFDAEQVVDDVIAKMGLEGD